MITQLSLKRRRRRSLDINPVFKTYSSWLPVTTPLPPKKKKGMNTKTQAWVCWLNKIWVERFETKPLIPLRWKTYITRKTLCGLFKVIMCLMKNLKLFRWYNRSVGTVAALNWAAIINHIYPPWKAISMLTTHPEAIWLLKSSCPSFACFWTGTEKAALPLKLLLSVLLGALGGGGGCVEGRVWTTIKEKT